MSIEQATNIERRVIFPMVKDLRFSISKRGGKRGNRSLYKCSKLNTVQNDIKTYF